MVRPILTLVVLSSAAAWAQGSRPSAEEWELLRAGGPVQRLSGILWLEDRRSVDVAAWQGLRPKTDEPELLRRWLLALGHVGHAELRPLLAGAFDLDDVAFTAPVRRAAAMAVGLLGDPALLVPLARRTGPLEVARALGMIGRLPEAEADRKFVLEVWQRDVALRDLEPGAAVWQDPVVARLRCGLALDPALLLPTVQQVLASKAAPPVQVVAAAWWLTRHKSRPPATLRASLRNRLLADGEAAGLAALALSRAEGADETDTRVIAERFLAGGERDVQIDRLRALGALPAAAARGAVLQALQGQDPFLRRTALETLARQGSAAFAGDSAGLRDQVVAVLELDPVVDVRRAAVAALAVCDPDLLARFLPRLRLCEPWPLRAATAELLTGARFAAQGGHTREILRRLLGDPDRRVVIAALEVLQREFSKPDSFGAIAADVVCDVFLDTRLAQPRCSHADDPVVLSVIAQIVLALQQRDDLRNQVLARADGQGAALLAYVLPRMPPHEVEALQSVVDLAAALGGDAGKAALQELLKSPEHTIRQRAGEALGKLGVAASWSRECDGASLTMCHARAERALSGKRTHALLRTNRGDLTLELSDDQTPATVDHFVALAEAGFFDGILFHRVVPAFVAQAGCPRGDGWGGPAFSQRCEVSDAPYQRGTLGMALAGKDTGGSQWFLCHRPALHLDGKYTVFGQVTDGLGTLDLLVPGDVILAVKIER